jgi:purine-binding chemotaxis protein CheW
MELNNSNIKQFLNFKIADEIYGIDVFQVREILEYIKITKVPQTPDYLTGVINLRGSVVPVIDMRLKFGLSKTEITVNTCIIVIEVHFDDEKNIIGALVDSVQEVIELDSTQIEEAPKLGTKLNIDFILGLGKHNDNFVILLNIDKIFSSEELTMINSEVK